jgi:O-antigen/teichoic acid export membrane protein
MGTSVDTSASSPSEGLARALTTVGTGAAVRAGSRVLITACTFATTVLVVRATGAERFGALAFGLSIVGLIAGLFTGFATASNRSIASVVATGGSPHEVVRAVSAVVLATAAAGAMVLLTSFALTQHQLDGEAVALLTVAMSLLLLGRVAAAAGSSIARGVGRMGLMEIPPTVEVVAKLGLVVALLAVGGLQGWLPLAVVYGGAGVAATVAAAAVVRRALGTMVAMAPAARAGVDLVRLTAPFVIGAIAFRLIRGFDVVVLGVVEPGTAVGAYAPALALIEGLVMLVPGLLGAMYVTAATGLHEAGDRRGFGDLFLSVSKVSVILAMPAFTLLAIAPTAAVRAVCGDALPVSPAVVRILLVGYFVTVALGFNGQALVAAGAWSAVGRALVVPAVTMIATAVVLIPVAGPVGAATASTISFVVLNASLSLTLRRVTGIHVLPLGRVALLGSTVLSIGLAAAAWQVVGGGFWGAVACSFAGWAVWLVVIMSARIVTLRELAALRPRRLGGRDGARR